jgi:hypothetical protein
MIADLVTALGVPQLWAQVIIFSVTLSLILYIIYMVSGRLISLRD